MIKESSRNLNEATVEMLSRIFSDLAFTRSTLLETESDRDWPKELKSGNSARKIIYERIKLNTLN